MLPQHPPWALQQPRKAQTGSSRVAQGRAPVALPTVGASCPSCPEPAKIRARFIGRAPTGWQSAPGVAGDKSVERVRTPSDRWAPASARHAGHAKGAQTGRAVVGRARPGRGGIVRGRCRQCGQEHEPCALGEDGHHRPATTGISQPTSGTVQQNVFSSGSCTIIQTRRCFFCSVFTNLRHRRKKNPPPKREWRKN